MSLKDVATKPHEDCTQVYLWSHVSIESVAIGYNLRGIQFASRFGQDFFQNLGGLSLWINLPVGDLFSSFFSFFWGLHRVFNINWGLQLID
jgi:hypothetical protein